MDWYRVIYVFEESRSFYIFFCTEHRPISWDFCRKQCKLSEVNNFFITFKISIHNTRQHSVWGTQNCAYILRSDNKGKMLALIIAQLYYRVSHEMTPDTCWSNVIVYLFYHAERSIGTYQESLWNETSIYFIAIAPCGLARDLAFNTKHLRITLPDGSPGFQTLTEIR